MNMSISSTHSMPKDKMCSLRVTTAAKQAKCVTYLVVGRGHAPGEVLHLG